MQRSRNARRRGLGVGIAATICFSTLALAVEAAQTKILVCHKEGTTAEKELRLPPKAAQGHMRGHGDTLGHCAPYAQLEVKVGQTWQDSASGNTLVWQFSAEGSKGATWRIDWDDLQPDSSGSAATLPNKTTPATHLFVDVPPLQTFRVKLTMTDAKGDVDTDVVTVTVPALAAP